MLILEILKAIFIGIVEGITEWLPVSSTGHMILVDEFIKIKMSVSAWGAMLSPLVRVRSNSATASLLLSYPIPSLPLATMRSMIAAV